MNRSRICWMWVLLLLLALAGCSDKPKPSPLVSAQGAFAGLRTAVRAEVKNPDKAAELVILVDQLEQFMVEASNDRKDHLAALQVLNANYDATEADFKAVFAAFNEKRNSRQTRILAIDQQARALTTAGEWQALAKDVARAFEASARAELGI